jgi:hypothetical protein
MFIGLLETHEVDKPQQILYPWDMLRRSSIKIN